MAIDPQDDVTLPEYLDDRFQGVSDRRRDETTSGARRVRASGQFGGAADRPPGPVVRAHAWVGRSGYAFGMADARRRVCRGED